MTESVNKANLSLYDFTTEFILEEAPNKKGPDDLVLQIKYLQ